MQLTNTSYQIRENENFLTHPLHLSVENRRFFPRYTYKAIFPTIVQVISCKPPFLHEMEEPLPFKKLFPVEILGNFQSK